MNKNEAIKEIEGLLSDAQLDYEYGGGEDSNGALMPGSVDWDELKNEIVQIIQQLKDDSSTA